MMRTTYLVPAMLASTLLVAPMLAYGQAQTSPPPGGAPSMMQGQTVTPGQPAPPAVGISPGMTPGGAVGQTPDPRPGMTQNQTGGASLITPRTATPGTATPGTTTPGLSSPGVAQSRTTPGATGQAIYGEGSAVMARPRMSQIIGANVYNQENNSIGSIDDVILVPPAGTGQQGPMAIVQVGGFLGIGGRLVSVPLADLEWNAQNERMVLSGATREGLSSRPEFSYDSLRTMR